jgi:Bestrophin, RFP-TM, chloride channel
MITYESSGALGLQLLGRFHGSAVYKVLIPVLLSTAFLVFVHCVLHYDEKTVPHPFPYGALIGFVSLLLTFNLNFAYQRYMEAETALHSMHSKWLDMAIQTAAFHYQNYKQFRNYQPPTFGTRDDKEAASLLRSWLEGESSPFAQHIAPPKSAPPHSQLKKPKIKQPTLITAASRHRSTAIRSDAVSSTVDPTLLNPRQRQFDLSLQEAAELIHAAAEENDAFGNSSGKSSRRLLSTFGRVPVTTVMEEEDDGDDAEANNGASVESKTVLDMTTMSNPKTIQGKAKTNRWQFPGFANRSKISRMKDQQASAAGSLEKDDSYPSAVLHSESDSDSRSLFQLFGRDQSPHRLSTHEDNSSAPLRSASRHSSKRPTTEVSDLTFLPPSRKFFTSEHPGVTMPKKRVRSNSAPRNLFGHHALPLHRPAGSTSLVHFPSLHVVDDVETATKKTERPDAVTVGSKCRSYGLLFNNAPLTAEVDADPLPSSSGRDSMFRSSSSPELTLLELSQSLKPDPKPPQPTQISPQPKPFREKHRSDFIPIPLRFQQQFINVPQSRITRREEKQAALLHGANTSGPKALPRPSVLQRLASVPSPAPHAIPNPTLFLQELAHLTSLLSAVALSSLRNSEISSISAMIDLPLTEYIPGKPWPSADPDQVTAADAEFNDDQWYFADTQSWWRRFVDYCLGLSRTDRQRTLYAAARPFGVLGGVSDAELRILRQVRGPSAQVTLCQMWIKEFVSREYLAHSLGDVGPPIVAQGVFSNLHGGTAGYNQARKIAYTPFVFPHAQISVLFSVCLIFFFPLLFESFVSDFSFGVILNFFTVACFLGTCDTHKRQPLSTGINCPHSALFFDPQACTKLPESWNPPTQTFPTTFRYDDALIGLLQFYSIEVVFSHLVISRCS